MKLILVSKGKNYQVIAQYMMPSCDHCQVQTTHDRYWDHRTTHSVSCYFQHLTKKIGVKKKIRGGRCGFFFFRKTILSHFTFYAIFSIKKNIEKCPFTYWLNGRGFLQIVGRDSCNLYPLNVGVVEGGGGGCNVFLTFYAISNISRRKQIWEYKTIIYHLMFSSCVFLYAGNIEKCPFTYSYWLNGRWFLQIVDIGHFIMRLEILKSAPSLTG